MKSIVIKWDYGTEYLDIDPDDADEDRIRDLVETRTWWPDLGAFVYYRVSCKVEKLDDGRRINVRYEMDRQEDENIIEAINRHEDPYWWGINTIIVNHDPQTERAKTRGSCTWRIDSGEKYEGWPRWQTVGRRRLRIKREQWQRESRFRKAVLAKDKKCVISGEATPEVLDAAHLRPVKEGGEELVENGFILRTDIHRLYDRGMFLINPEDGKISMSRNLSDKYKKLLRNAELPKGTLHRVQKALQERWKNPRGDSGDA